jgi:hypothetical protein
MIGVYLLIYLMKPAIFKLPFITKRSAKRLASQLFAAIISYFMPNRRIA